MRHATYAAERLATPEAWCRIHSLEGISEDTLRQMVDKGGFDQLPDKITWKEYQTVVRMFFPWGTQDAAHAEDLSRSPNHIGVA